MRRLLSTLLLASVGMSAPASAQDFAGREKLRAHSNEFRKEVIRVTDGVYAAVGFDLANAIMIDGVDGRIIVDTATGRDNAMAIKAEFDRISSKPVRAIIYTHHHQDHVGGASVFAGGDRPEIYAHRSLLPDRRAETSAAPTVTAATSSARRCRRASGSTPASDPHCRPPVGTAT